MFVGEVNTSSNQEPEFSEKEDDEWILVDFIGKVLLAANHHHEVETLASQFLHK